MPEDGSMEGVEEEGFDKGMDSSSVAEEMPVDDGSDIGSDSADSNSFTGEQPISVTNLNQMVDEADNANRVMTLLLGAIAAISLLVGGLGIMNIMLVAVTERIEEIGVRRALGARQGDLIVQFMVEALYLSGFGALVGVIAGLSLLNVFNSLRPYRYHQLRCNQSSGAGSLRLWPDLRCISRDLGIRHSACGSLKTVN